MKNSNKKYLICNFKSIMLKDELIEFENNLLKLEQSEKIKMIICPPTTYLYIFKNSIYGLGSQEISMYENGAYTGENSGEQLKSLNVKYALIGHSESRRILNETNESMTKKIINAYKNDITPIYFIGEATKTTENVCELLYKQLTAVLDRLPKDIIDKMIIVYEPYWSIGTGKIPSVYELNQKITNIKEFIKKKYNIVVPLLYGGSINENNIELISQIEVLDGIIIGESSTNYEILTKIYKKYQKVL